MLQRTRTARMAGRTCIATKQSVVFRRMENSLGCSVARSSGGRPIESLTVSRVAWHPVLSTVNADAFQNGRKGENTSQRPDLPSSTNLGLSTHLACALRLLKYAAPPMGADGAKPGPTKKGVAADGTDLPADSREGKSGSWVDTPRSLASTGDMRENTFHPLSRLPAHTNVVCSAHNGHSRGAGVRSTCFFANITSPPVGT